MAVSVFEHIKIAFQRTASSVFEHIKIAFESTITGTDEWYTLQLGSGVRGWFFATGMLKNGKYTGFQVTWWEERRVPDKAKMTSWAFRDLRGRTISESEVPPKVVARVRARI